MLKNLRPKLLLALLLGFAASVQAEMFDGFVILKTEPVVKDFPLHTAAIKSNKLILEDFSTFVQELGGTVKKHYLSAFVGLHIEVDSADLDEIRADDRVKSVSPNSAVYIRDVANSWGVDRSDQRNLPLDNSYNVPSGGAGVHVYVVDTGVTTTHQEFTNIGDGFSAIANDPSTADCHGHGTHVAGTVAGKTVGIARKATIHPVRVLNCTGSGTLQGIADGIEWVIKNKKDPAVINMSLGGGANDAFDTATNNAIKAGITVVAAAGNSSDDACKYSPARVPGAVTVAASTKTDTQASFSSFGKCVDIYAPGEAINSASNTDNAGYRSFNGTSMAAPHVAGAAALILGNSPTLKPADVADKLIKDATPSKISNPGAGTPNLLLYVQAAATNSLKVSAGDDVLLKLPLDYTTLVGKVTSSSPLAWVKWKQLSGPALANDIRTKDAEYRLELSGLKVGSYVFELSASDGVTKASDEVNVTVTKQETALLPYVDAGEDITVKIPVGNIVLDGVCRDADGYCKEMTWLFKTKSLMKADYRGSKLILSNLDVGRYEFTLNCIDDQGNVNEDTVVVNVTN